MLKAGLFYVHLVHLEGQTRKHVATDAGVKVSQSLEGKELRCQTLMEEQALSALALTRDYLTRMNHVEDYCFKKCRAGGKHDARSAFTACDGC